MAAARRSHALLCPAPPDDGPLPPGHPLCEFLTLGAKFETLLVAARGIARRIGTALRAMPTDAMGCANAAQLAAAELQAECADAGREGGGAGNGAGASELAADAFMLLRAAWHAHLDEDERAAASALLSADLYVALVGTLESRLLPLHTECPLVDYCTHLARAPAGEQRLALSLLLPAAQRILRSRGVATAEDPEGLAQADGEAQLDAMLMAEATAAESEAEAMGVHESAGHRIVTARRSCLLAQVRTASHQSGCMWPGRDRSSG